MKGLKSGAVSVLLLYLAAPELTAGWGSGYEKVLLKEVQVLTLREGAMSSGRRSSPVPQLSCVGGSAGCRGEDLPQVAQCYNMGLGREGGAVGVQGGHGQQVQVRES